MNAVEFSGNYAPLEEQAHLKQVRSDGAAEPCRAGAVILAYLWQASAYALSRALGVTQQTVSRCLERAAQLRVIETLDDRPRSGRDRVVTGEAKAWPVALASRKAKELGYRHELWTPGCWLRMRVPTGRQAIRAWRNWRKGRSARSG